ncbi:MAG: HEAT repeat domain-containing protein [Nannocystaceae bacterium]
MLAPEMTLDAALRDVERDDPRVREPAVRNLAPALLAELGQTGPRWDAAAEHPRGESVIEALGRRLDDDEPALRGHAATGLATLGDVTVLEPAEGWLELTGDDEHRAYLRQCGVIALSFLARAAIEADVEPTLRRRIEARIIQALSAEPPDLRFQAGMALVELRGADAEPALVDALRREQHSEVLEGLLDAVAMLDPPGPAACEALESILEGPEAQTGIGFRAAMTLAAARRPVARPRLLEALDVRSWRDDALEALAALGTAEPADVERIHRLARRVFLPGITRVRAAYALARMVGPGAGDNPGLAMLERMRWHPRAAVREAVQDAFSNLDTLASRETQSGP